MAAAAPDGNGTTDPGTGRPSWWGWPLHQWPWPAPALAPQQLYQPISTGVSLFNVTHVNSSAPDIERDVLQKHSYGRQIGRLMDAVVALAERLPATAKDDKRIAEFEALARDVERIKCRTRLPRLERLRDEIEELRRDDPHAYDQLRAMLAR